MRKHVLGFSLAALTFMAAGCQSTPSWTPRWDWWRSAKSEPPKTGTMASMPPNYPPLPSSTATPVATSGTAAGASAGSYPTAYPLTSSPSTQPVGYNQSVYGGYGPQTTPYNPNGYPSGAAPAAAPAAQPTYPATTPMAAPSAGYPATSTTTTPAAAPSSYSPAAGAYGRDMRMPSSPAAAPASNYESDSRYGTNAPGQSGDLYAPVVPPVSPLGDRYGNVPDAGAPAASTADARSRYPDLPADPNSSAPPTTAPNSAPSAASPAGGSPGYRPAGTGTYVPAKSGNTGFGSLNPPNHFDAGPVSAGVSPDVMPMPPSNVAVPNKSGDGSSSGVVPASYTTP